jgi:hypothetical protein
VVRKTKKKINPSTAKRQRRKTMIKLYKNGKLVDFGVESRIREYMMQGYEVQFDDTPQPTFGHYQRKFDALWETLSAGEKKRLDFTVDDDELSVEEKIAYIEMTIASRKKEEICRKKRLSFGRMVIGALKKTYRSLVGSQMITPRSKSMQLCLTAR